MENNENQIIHDESQDKLSVAIFARDFKQIFSIDFLKNGVRLTPQGVFIEISQVTEVLAKYQDWLQKKTQGAYGLNEAKAFKRAFLTETPTHYYLLEGKKCLFGVLMPVELKDLPSFQVPYYLGSLISADNYISVQDSRLDNISNIIVHSQDEIEIKIKRWSYKFTKEKVLEFRALIERNKQLSKRFYNVKRSLLDTVLALKNILFNVKPLERYSRVLIPIDLPKKYLILQERELIFIFDENSSLISCYENCGFNLYSFVHSEALKIASRKMKDVASLHFAVDKASHLVITVKNKGLKYSVLVNALRDLVEFCSPENVPHTKIPLRYTLDDCCQAFSVICERADFIDKKHISRYVEKLNEKAVKFMCFEKWILALDKRNTIIHCVEKGAKKKERQEKTPKTHQKNSRKGLKAKASFRDEKK